MMVELATQEEIRQAIANGYPVFTEQGCLTGIDEGGAFTGTFYDGSPLRTLATAAENPLTAYEIH